MGFKYFGAFLISLMLVACTPSIKVSSRTSLVPEGEGPWQIVTYQEERIERAYTIIEDGKLYRETRSVYLAKNGQFVFSDETPITDWKGRNLFFNEQGLVVTEQLKVVPESSIFSVNGVPLEDGNPLTFKETFDIARAGLNN